jgi:RNA polymerase sigma factor (TIGR02999 family)
MDKTLVDVADSGPGAACAEAFVSSCVVPRQRASTSPGERLDDAAGTADELLPQVYEQLRRLADRLLAAEPRGQTLQPTALVHEAWLRLAGPRERDWQGRAHFFGAAARAIRCILIDRARARRRDKRGSGRRPLPLELADSIAAPAPGADLLDVDAALRRLEDIDAQKARVVELRFFGGLSVDEAAEALGVSPATVTRDWRFARAWLHRELSCEGA